MGLAHEEAMFVVRSCFEKVTYTSIRGLLYPAARQKHSNEEYFGHGLVVSNQRPGPVSCADTIIARGDRTHFQP